MGAIGRIKRKLAERQPESPDRPLETMKRVFKALAGPDGNIDRSEFEQGFKDFGIDVSSQELTLIMNHFDTNGDGSIDLQEFTDGLTEGVDALATSSRNGAAGSGVYAVRAARTSGGERRW